MIFATQSTSALSSNLRFPYQRDISIQTKPNVPKALQKEIHSKSVHNSQVKAFQWLPREVSTQTISDINLFYGNNFADKFSPHIYNYDKFVSFHEWYLHNFGV